MNNLALKSIQIKGARVHNLKGVDLELPRNKFIVITGVSGSGKSSLAFDTLYAEGQRRYVESLSSYARQFLGRIDKPEVDFIKGIPPAIAIEQKVNTRNPRSTVGTSTEVYDYLKLLFARIGKTISPVSGEEVKRHYVSDVVDHITQFEEKTRLVILSEIHVPLDRSCKEHLEILLKQGFARIEKDNEFFKIEDVLKDNEANIECDYNLVIDRATASKEEDNLTRLADSVETAFFEVKANAWLKFSKSRRYLHITFLISLSRMEFSLRNPANICLPLIILLGPVLNVKDLEV